MESRGRTERLQRLVGREEAERVFDAARRSGAIDAGRRDELEAPNGAAAADLLVARGWMTREAAAALLEESRREDVERVRRSRVAPPPPDVAAAAADPARRLDGFVLVEELGRGGGGEVWKAWDLGLSRWVAVKRPGPGVDSARFLKEALAAARLSHPNIVPVHRVSDSPERPWFAMQLAEGRPLSGAKLEARRAAAILRKTALAVEAAHAAGIVHRDLKPANVVIDERDEPRILDFGIAGWGGRPAAGISGTPGFMAPEQRSGGPDAERPAVDVHGLGATLGAVVADPVPKRLRAIIQRATEADPASRHPSAAAFAEDLERYLEAPRSFVPGWMVGAGFVVLVLLAVRLVPSQPDLGAELAILADRSVAARKAGRVEEYRRLADEARKVAAGQPEGPARDLELARFHRVRGEDAEARALLGAATVPAGLEAEFRVERILAGWRLFERERRIRGTASPEFLAVEEAALARAPGRERRPAAELAAARVACALARGRAPGEDLAPLSRSGIDLELRVAAARAKGEHAEAIELALEGLEADPSARELRLALAEALSADGRPAEAEAEATRAVDADPGAPDARVLRASLRSRAGDAAGWMGAEADLAEAAKSLPDEAGIQRQLAETRCSWATALSREGQPVGDLFERALKIARDPVLEGAILAARGDHRIRVGEDPEPDYAAAEARLASSKDPAAWRHLAGIRYNRGDRAAARGEDPGPHYASAIEDYGRAIAQQPDPELRLLRGCVHWNYGVRLRKDDAARAREQFRLAVEDLEKAAESEAYADRAGEYLRNARRELDR